MEVITSKYIHLKENSGVSNIQFLKVLDDALLNFGGRCLVSYCDAYKEDPKAFISSFLKFDSIKMGCQFAVKYGKEHLKEFEGKKDFSGWVEKQNLSEKWKPVLEKILLLIWGLNQE